MYMDSGNAMGHAMPAAAGQKREPLPGMKKK
jgi:hypothetical protein